MITQLAIRNQFSTPDHFFFFYFFRQQSVDFFFQFNSRRRPLFQNGTLNRNINWKKKKNKHETSLRSDFFQMFLVTRIADFGCEKSFLFSFRFPTTAQNSNYIFSHLNGIAWIHQMESASEKQSGRPQINERNWNRAIICQFKLEL